MVTGVCARRRYLPGIDWEEVMRLLAIAVSSVVASLSLAAPAYAQTAGIQSLVTVAQVRAENANEDALDGAERQRSLVRQQQRLRSNQRAIEDTSAQRNLSNARLGAAGAIVCRGCAVQTTSDNDNDEDD
jgi:hypothetical protein